VSDENSEVGNGLTLRAECEPDQLKLQECAQVSEQDTITLEEDSESVSEKLEIVRSEQLMESQTLVKKCKPRQTRKERDA
jgi:hypothetical protein